MMGRLMGVAGLVLLLAWTVGPAPVLSAVEGSAPPASGEMPSAAPAEEGKAPVEITGIEVQTLEPTSASLLITSDGPLVYPESFSLPDPPRVVIDIPSAVHAIRQPIPVAKGGAIATIHSTQYREQPVKVVRVVLDLATALPYRLEVVENQLRVFVGEAAEQPEEVPALAQVMEPEKVEALQPSEVLEAPPPEEVPKPPKEEVAAPPVEGRVTKIDFLPLPDRSRIIIATEGKVSYRILEIADPPRLAVDVSEALIAPEARRSLDVQQLPGVVKRVRSAQFRREPEKVVRVVAELKQQAKYEVKQEPEGITLDLFAPPPVAAAPPEAPPPALPPPPEEIPEMAEMPALPEIPVPPPPAPPAIAPPSPGKLSLDFKDAEIDNILRILAEVSGMNIVAGEDVKGKVTVRLINVDWRQALNVILKVNKLDYIERDNIIWVASQKRIQEERAAKEEAERLARQKVREQVQLEPLVTKILPVNYSTAKDMQKHLERLKTPGRTDVSIVVDERTNSLIVNDIPAAIDRMEALLNELDKPTPQVLIEARIVEASRTFSQSLGISWGGAAQFDTSFGSRQPIFNVFGTTAGADVKAPTIGPTEVVPLFLNFPAIGTAPVALGLTISKGDNLLLGAQLSAAEREGRVKTLSAPKVATLDNEEAEIKQGTQVPFTTIDSSGRTVVSFIDAFIRLKVTPHITADKRVSMKVEAERSFPGDRIDFAGGFSFPINTRKATTRVLVPDGGTIVIAGLFQSTEQITEDRVPFLWKIPFLGYLFKRHNVGPDERVELLIFLTPTILEEVKMS